MDTFNSCGSSNAVRVKIIENKLEILFSHSVFYLILHFFFDDHDILIVRRYLDMLEDLSHDQRERVLNFPSYPTRVVRLFSSYPMSDNSTQTSSPSYPTSDNSIDYTFSSYPILMLSARKVG